MEWVLGVVSAVVVLLLVAPLAALLAVVLLLWVAGNFLPSSPVISRAAFDCPFSRRRASVEFLSAPGDERPTGVLSCSVFKDPHRVRCKKGCLALAATRWAPSAMMPRFALLAGEVTYRVAPAAADRG